MKAGKKLIIAMAVISLVPSLVIAFVVNIHMHNSIQELQQRSLESLSNVVAAHIYDFCNGQEMDSRFFGQVTAYRKCLEAHENGAGTQELEYWDKEVMSLFDRTTTINDNIDGGALIDLSGMTILAYDKKEVGRSVVDTEMYKSIVNGGELYRKSVVNEDGSRNIDIVVPVRDDDGKLIGMMKRVVNLSNLNLYIDEVEIGETGYVYVVDEDATLIYHGSEEKMDLAVGEFQDRDELDDLLDKVAADTLEESGGIIHYNNRGVDTIAAYSKINELDWVVLVAMDESEVLNPVDIATRTIGIVSVLVGLVTALACYFIVQAFLLPLFNIRDTLRRVVCGEFSARCIYREGDELAEIMEGINDMAFKLEKSGDELRRAELHDPLTGLYNRTGVMAEIRRMLYSQEKQALLLIDMDEFEVLNETLGQNVADGVLTEMADKFAQLPSNVARGGRYGGDSFLFLVNTWEEETSPEKIAARIRNDIEQIRFVADRPVHVTASVGIVYIDEPGIDLNTYLKKANSALYKAKHSGKNTDVVFSEDF